MTVNTRSDIRRVDAWRLWRAERHAAATSPHGLASVTGTHWLDDTPQTIVGLPGRWTAAEAESIDGERMFGELLVTAIRRDGRIALRVFDPAAVDVSGVDAFEFDPAWVVDGSFLPVAAGATTRTLHVDGRRGDSALAGTVALTLAGYEVQFEALAAANGLLHLVFADATNGNTTQQFRFLFVERPALGDLVELDFNRAVLPPCAFTDHYLCPLPPARNRLGFEVTAGETFVTR